MYLQGRATQGFYEFAEEWQRCIPALVGVELVEETGLGLESKQIAHWGESSIVYRASGFDYRVDHGSFFQINRWLIDKLVQWVIANRHGGLAWDLFAGVGLFSRQLADRFTEVIAVESAPQATAALGKNLEGTCGRAVVSDTLSFLRTKQGTPRPDLVVVDPPRAGLAPETTTLLARSAAPNIIYVSCDPATLARDLRALLSSGYSLASVALADLFPQTFHLETVVELQRS